jgi:hypothetical protein
MNVGANETGQMTHCSLCRVNKQINELLLPASP